MQKLFRLATAALLLGVLAACSQAPQVTLPEAAPEADAPLTAQAALETKLTASDGAAGDWFGRSVAISGDTAIVGAFTDNIDESIDAGSAYLFEPAPPNTPPSATEDSYTTPEDTSLSGNVLTNDTDEDGDTLSATLETGVSNGSLTLNSDGSFSYTPNADYCGTDSFTYSASDGEASDTATVTITITCVNDDPTVIVDNTSVTVDEGQTASNSGSYGDVDSDGVTLSASVGTITRSDGTWSWSFATSDGPDDSQTVTITADDGDGGTAQVTFLLTVKNVAPTIDSFNLSEDTIILGQTVTASGAFSDPGDDTLAASIDWDDGAESSVSTPFSQVPHAYTSADSYTVQLEVDDGDGDVTKSQKTLTVLTLEEAVNNLIGRVEESDLPKNTAKSLVSLLEQTVKSLEQEDMDGAKDKLESFINQVEAQRGKKIASDDADSLIEAAQEILDLL